MNKNNNLKKATLSDVKNYKELRARLYSLSEEQDDERDQTARQLSELDESLDWQPEGFKEGGKEGLKDLDGSILVPARFDAIATTFARHSAFADNPVIVVEGGRFGIVKADGSGDMVLPCEHDHISVMSSAPHCYVVEDGGHKGVILGSGKQLIPQVADTLYDPCNGALIFKAGDRFGLWAEDYDLYVEPLYDDLDAELDAPFSAVKDGVSGYLSASDGHFITEEEWEETEEQVLGCFI